LSLGLRYLRQPVEVVFPHLGENSPQRSESSSVRLVQTGGTTTTGCHQIRLLQDTQVLRDRRPADVESRRNLSRRALFVPYQTKDLAPTRAGYCPQLHVLHETYVITDPELLQACLN